MLCEKDKAVVASMVRTGMSLDVLKKSFPQFSSEDVEKIFNEENGISEEVSVEDITISCNCS